MAAFQSIPRTLAQRSIAVASVLLGIYGFALTVNTPNKVEYNESIQPILTAHCLQCHSGKNKAAGLDLSNAKNVLSARILIAGQADKSLLLDRILGKRGMPRMPMGFGPLNDQDVQLIRDWINQGCFVSNVHKRHWAYVNPTRPIVPTPAIPRWVKNPIDAFVAQKLKEVDLHPSPEADKITLIRRVSLDLTGLPPEPGDVDRFVADTSTNAYEKLVDRLLASPHYGERMALPWLDAARYSDSNGFQQDGDNYQYVWRDWVINAFNKNLPFDQFTIQQLAGDLLPGSASSSPEGIQKLVATGFVRNNMLNGEGGAIPEEQRNVALFDRVDTCSTTWLGITMACARCHDHKYDPFTQKDYYSLLAFFNRVPESGIPSDNMGGYYIAQPWIYAGSPEEMTRLGKLESQEEELTKKWAELESSSSIKAAEIEWIAQASKVPNQPKEVLEFAAKDPAKRSKDENKRLHEQFVSIGLVGDAKNLHDNLVKTQQELEKLRTDIPKVMVMSDKQPRKAHIFSRGNYEAPLAEVHPTTPDALPPMTIAQPKNRLGLANWIVSPENPLTARVQVNRYWQMLFGRGLVKTPENFGVQSEPPIYKDLLDWMAVEFRQSGWDIKHMMRLIVTSATYRQSSRVSKDMLKFDLDNRYLSRGARFRLPSMLIRDEALAASGLINLKLGGKPVYPYQPKGIWDGLNITDERDFSYPQSKGADLYRRSIYTFWRRTVGPGNMFDSASRQVCTVRSSRTSTPLHALTTLNDVTWVEAGRVLAERVIHESTGDPKIRLTNAFRRVCARKPNTKELAILSRSLSKSLEFFRHSKLATTEFLHQGEHPTDPKIDPTEEAAYANVCHAILNLDEALTKE